MNLSLVLLVFLATPASPVLVLPGGFLSLAPTPVEALHEPEFHDGAAGDLVGTVRDVRGEALRQARVFLEGTGRSAYTDAGGSFVIRDVPAGRYSVRVQNLGYGPAVVSVIVAGERPGGAIAPGGSFGIVLERTLAERTRGPNRIRRPGMSPCLPDEVVP